MATSRSLGRQRGDVRSPIRTVTAVAAPGRRSAGAGSSSHSRSGRAGPRTRRRRSPVTGRPTPVRRRVDLGQPLPSEDAHGLIPPWKRKPYRRALQRVDEGFPRSRAFMPVTHVTIRDHYPFAERLTVGRWRGSLIVHVTDSASVRIVHPWPPCRSPVAVARAPGPRTCPRTVRRRRRPRRLPGGGVKAGVSWQWQLTGKLDTSVKAACTTSTGSTHTKSRSRRSRRPAGRTSAT